MRRLPCSPCGAVFFGGAASGDGPSAATAAQLPAIRGVCRPRRSCRPAVPGVRGTGPRVGPRGEGAAPFRRRRARFGKALAGIFHFSKFFCRKGIDKAGFRTYTNKAALNGYKCAHLHATPDSEPVVKELKNKHERYH